MSDLVLQQRSNFFGSSFHVCVGNPYQRQDIWRHVHFHRPIDIVIPKSATTYPEIPFIQCVCDVRSSIECCLQWTCRLSELVRLKNPITSGTVNEVLVGALIATFMLPFASVLRCSNSVAKFIYSRNKKERIGPTTPKFDALNPISLASRDGHRHCDGDRYTYQTADRLHPCWPVNVRWRPRLGRMLAQHRPNQQCASNESHKSYHRPVAVRASVLHLCPPVLVRILAFGVLI